MVCLPCIAAPVLLFIWYKFFYPLLRPILERYFGDRFAEPKDGSCPVCPRNSKGKCELATATSTPEKTTNESPTSDQQSLIGDKKED